MFSIPPFLWKTLILPVAVAAIASFLLACFVPWQGLFMNLATTFLGILITVVYVDYVMKRHEELYWSGAKFKIVARLQQVAARAGTQFRHLFDLDLDSLPIGLTKDRAVLRVAMIRLNEEILLPGLKDHVSRLSQEQWAKVAKALKGTDDEVQEFLRIYGNRLDPVSIEGLMGIQDEVRAFLNFYQIFPDLFGVPDDSLPLTRSGDRPIEHKRALEGLAAECIGRLLKHSSQLQRHAAELEKRV